MRFAALAFCLWCCLPGLGHARDFPPEVLPAKPLVIPAPVMRTLPNGLEVLLVERHTLPLVTLRLAVRSGPECDPPALPGAAALVNGLLTEGTTRRSAQQIAEAIDSAGGLVENDAGWDESYLSLSVPSDQARLAFDLVGDMVMHPAFLPAEIERQRRQTLSSLEVVYDDPAYLADTVFQEAAFAGTAYGHPEDGTPRSVAGITAGDLRSFHALYYQPRNSILTVAGDISATEAWGNAGEFFSSWQNTEELPAPPTVHPTSFARRRLLILDKPAAVQTEIRIGGAAVPRAHPDYLALSLVNEILGGPAENRLFKALRTQQGLAYGASSELVCRRRLGAWLAKTSTRTQETAKCLRSALEQIQSLHDHPLTPQDIETAQRYLVGHLPLQFENSEDVADRALELLEDGLPLDYWSGYGEKVRALTPQEVERAAQGYFDPKHDVVVLVGNASQFEKGVKKLGRPQLLSPHQVESGVLER